MFDKEMMSEEMPAEAPKESGGMRSKLLKELIEMLMAMPDEKKAEVEIAVEEKPEGLG